jgi:chromosomal replication initiation ATPase DnaA
MICAEVEAAFAGQGRLVWGIQMYLCQKYARMKLKDIGAYFEVGESGVCQAARWVTARMKTDRRLTKRIDAMEKRFPA